MTNDQWHRARPVLTQAIGLDPVERDRLIQSVFADDSGLRVQLVEVLKQYRAATRRFPAAEASQRYSLGDDRRESNHSSIPAADIFFLNNGDMCGRYRVVRPLGVGGMGQVYLAEDIDLGTPVALKLVSNPLLDSPEARSRLRREAARAAQLRYHPHIATVLQFMELELKQRLVTVLAMEYVGGRTADQIVAEGPLKCARAIDWAVQVARAMEFAHEKGLVHCDLKPANLQIEERSEGDRVKVLDFGIARAVFESPTSEGLAGTPAYMAPEQLIAADCSPAADIYSLGVTIFELVTGRRPYPSTDTDELLLQVIAGPVPRASASMPGLPRTLDDVLQRAMAKEPERRYRSMTELRKDLEVLLPAEKPASWSVYVLGAVVGFFVVALCGFAASQALDQGLGRVQHVGLSSVFSWFYWGGRSLVAPIVFSIELMLAFLCVAALVRLMASIPGLGGLVRRVGHPARRYWIAVSELPTSTLAQALLLGHVAVLAALFAYFYPLLEGFANFMTSQGPIDVLKPSNQPMHALYGYLVTTKLLVFCLAWYSLLRLRTRRRDRDGLAFIVAGLAAIAISAFVFTARFKILSHNDSERVVYNSNTCYLVEDRGTTALLFCPLTYPRNVVASMNSIERTGNIENVFTALEP